jgi:hypothetical protein
MAPMQSTYEQIARKVAAYAILTWEIGVTAEVHDWSSVEDDVWLVPFGRICPRAVRRGTLVLTSRYDASLRM